MIPQYLGSCRVQLVLDRDTVRWEEAVTGACIFLGGQCDQPVVRVEAALVMLASVSDSPRAVRDSQPAIWTDLMAPAGGKVELRFALRVPDGSVLGSQVLVLLTVRLPELWGQATHRAYVTVEPSRSYAELAEVAAGLTGLQIGEWRLLGGGDGVGVRLHPKPSTPACLDGLDLEIFRSKSGFYGEAIVDPRGPGLANTLRGIAGLDRVRHPFHLPPGDREEAERQFAELLRPHIHPNRQHPLPSQPPISVLSNSFPIPAPGAPPSTTDLPRASSDPEKR